MADKKKGQEISPLVADLKAEIARQDKTIRALNDHIEQLIHESDDNDATFETMWDEAMRIQHQNTILKSTLEITEGQLTRTEAKLEAYRKGLLNALDVMRNQAETVSRMAATQDEAISFAEVATALSLAEV